MQSSFKVFLKNSMPLNETVKHHGLIIRVAIPSPLRRVFDYLPPIVEQLSIEPGMRVRVPFGKREVVGVVVESAQDSTLPPNRLKSIRTVLDREPLFSSALFRTLLWAAAYYQHPIGEVFQTALPVKLRSTGPVKVDTTVYRVLIPLDGDISTSLKQAKKQKSLLELIESEFEVNESRIKNAGYSRRTLNQLMEKNLVKRYMVASERVAKFKPPTSASELQLPLNDAQKVAVKTILKSSDSYACYLLDGVTGSGKTEVYMQLIQHQLANGRQCLVLVPEIGLTPQTVSRFRERFTCPVVVMHSGLSDAARLDAWNHSRQCAYRAL